MFNEVKMCSGGIDSCIYD